MQRIKIRKENQKKFFKTIKSASNLNWDKLGKICGLSGRTLRDWARCKYTPSYKASIFLSRKFKVNLPDDYKILDQYWYINKYARMGGLARQKIYGLLGDIKTRQKGGFACQQRRRENPEKYRRLGCQIAKKFKPLKQSIAFAEMVGIILGDGGITDSQLRITLNKKTDKKYAVFVKKLMHKVFKEIPSTGIYHNVLVLTLSGVNLIKELEKIGLKRGNKIVNQISIPAWILRNDKYARACARGMIDTDGCVYFHRHLVKNKRYINLGLTFTNHSMPLIDGVNKIFTNNDFYPSVIKNKRIYIYNLAAIKRYFKIIGSNNPKHTNKFNSYLNLYKI